MNIETILIGFAQIGVVLIGFSSVFLTFMLRDKTPDPVMQMHARALMMVAPFILALSILPLTLMGFGLGAVAALRWSTAVILVPGAIVGALNNRYFFKLSKSDRRRTGYWHMALANMILLANLGLCGVIFFGNAVFGGYIGLMGMSCAASTLAIFTFSIEELRLFNGFKKDGAE